MPPEPGTPGAFIAELGGPPRIEAAPTSVCAFVGRAARGPVDTPVEIRSFTDFQHRFGGLWSGGSLGFTVRDYFANGGSTAFIVRAYAAPAGRTAPAGRAVLRHGPLTLVATDPGSWGNQLRIRVDHETRPPRADLGETAQSLFNLTIRDAGTGVVEAHQDVTIGILGHPRDLGAVLATESQLLRVMSPGPGMTASRPEPHAQPEDGDTPWTPDTSTGVGTDPDDLGADGDPLTITSLLGGAAGADRAGMYALDDVDLFTLLVIAPDQPSGDVDPVVLGAAHAYCEERRAILLVDGPAAWSEAPDVASAAAAGVGALGANAAMYFPRVRAANPVNADQVESFPAAGAIAGVLARGDAQHGVWKPPAGREAVLRGVSGLARQVSRELVGELTPIGINCLREISPSRPVVWGARTTAGADSLGSEWKYLSVRRTALLIEESLYRGTRWVVFEPNDEPLWATLRTCVGDFLHTLYRAGAFQGASPRDAYFIRCDRSTTTAADIERGVVNVLVGFAPLKPAEFILLRIQLAAAPH